MADTTTMAKPYLTRAVALTDSGAGVGVMAKIVSILAKAKHGTPSNKPPCFVWEIGQQNAHTSHPLPIFHDLCKESYDF